MYKMGAASHGLNASFSDKSFKPQFCPQRTPLYAGFHLCEGESDLQTQTGMFCTIEGETVVEFPSITQSLRAVYRGKRVMLCRLYPWTLLTFQALWSGAHLPWNK